MAQSLQNLELSALHFAPQLLFAGGVIVVLAGLCAWLGGLRWTALFATALGTTAGLTVACIFTSATPGPLVAVGLISGGVGCLLKKPLVIFTGAAFAALVALVVLATPAIAAGEPLKLPSHPMPYEDGQRKTLTFSQSISELKSELLFWIETINSAVRRSSVAPPVAALVAAIAVIAAGLLIPRFVAAATCASLGTLAVFAGMISVLLYKGARPLTGIHQRQAFFAFTFWAMVGFGTLVQLLLCPAPRKKSQGERQESGGK